MKPRKRAFNAQAFLDSAGLARRAREYASKETIFSQGDSAKSVLYIQNGSVKLPIVSKTGKEAVVGLLCLTAQRVRMCD